MLSHSRFKDGCLSCRLALRTPEWDHVFDNPFATGTRMLTSRMPEKSCALSPLIPASHFFALLGQVVRGFNESFLFTTHPGL